MPLSVLAEGDTTDLDALVKDYERSGFDSLKSLGLLLVVSAGAWTGVELARAKHPLNLLANWATMSPLLDTNTTLGAELAVLSVIATLCVALMVGVRINEGSPVNMPRLSRWSEAISDSLMMLSATGLVLAISQVVHEPTPGGSWVCVVVAGVGLILVATTAPDQSSFERLRTALDARNARLGQTAAANLKA